MSVMTAVYRMRPARAECRAGSGFPRAARILDIPPRLTDYEREEHSEKRGAVERDPVCGMQVDPEKARARGEHGGRTYYFCCEGCAQKFRAAPEKYLSAPPKVSAPSLIVLTPGPVAGSSSALASGASAVAPAAAPLAVATSAPAASAASAAAAEYTCPMHPEIIQRGPGSCPICGMALEPRAISAEEEPNEELDLDDQALLGQRRADSAGVASGDGRDARRIGGWLLAARARVAPVRADDAGCALGRLAIFRARLVFDRSHAAEYVHADCRRDRHRVSSTASSPRWPRERFRRAFARPAATFPSISRRPR